jgi:hypothetical protein
MANRISSRSHPVKIISILSRLSTTPNRGAEAREPSPAWVGDPLAHPDLDAMSERELADLPFSRGMHPAQPTNSRCA